MVSAWHKTRQPAAGSGAAARSAAAYGQCYLRCCIAAVALGELTCDHLGDVQLGPELGSVLPHGIGML